MIAVFLLVVLWQAHTAPTVSVYLVPNVSDCHKLALSFEAAEIEHNQEAPLAFKDSWAVDCEVRDGDELNSP